MSPTKLVITFENHTAAESNLFAEDLRNSLLDASPDIVVERARNDPAKMDMGGTLIISVLSAPAVLTVIRRIESWLQKTHSATITISTSDNKLEIKNITSKQAAKIAELEMKLRETNNSMK